MTRNRQEPQFGYTPTEEEEYLTAARPRSGANSGEGRYTETGPRRRSYFPLLAVIIAFVIFAGLIWKSYKHHHITAASGQPPVITAEQTPVKIKPEAPGGTDIPYRDTTVYDELAGAKQKNQPPAVEHLLQPPEEPLPKPVAAAPEPPPPQAAPPVETQPPVSAPVQAEAALQPPPPPTAVPGPDEALTSPTALAPQEPVPAAPPPAAPSAPTAVASDMPPPVPPEKPAMPAPQASVLSAAPASLGGSYAVQLGAFKDAATANGEWLRLQKSYPTQLGSLSPLVEKIDVPGKGTLYRLRGTPLTSAQAKAACDALKAQNVTCLVAAR